MSIKKIGWILALISPFLVSLPSAAENQLPAPNASSLLAGTSQSFLVACRADLTETKKRIADIKADKSHPDARATLQAFDIALLVGSDAQARANLAEQVHPAKEFREASQVCEQEASQTLTDISLDKGMYNVLASLDGSKLDSAGKYFLRTTLRDYHRAGVDRDDATRAKIRALQDELIKIGQEFEKNIPEDVRKLQINVSELDGLPDDYKGSHPADASGKGLSPPTTPTTSRSCSMPRATPHGRRCFCSTTSALIPRTSMS
jgi:thimet oligopeptidase